MLYNYFNHRLSKITISLYLMNLTQKILSQPRLAIHAVYDLDQ